MSSGTWGQSRKMTSQVWPGPVSMAENVKIINDRSILERAGARASKTNN